MTNVTKLITETSKPHTDYKSSRQNDHKRSGTSQSNPDSNFERSVQDGDLRRPYINRDLQSTVEVDDRPNFLLKCTRHVIYLLPIYYFVDSQGPKHS